VQSLLLLLCAFGSWLAALVMLAPNVRDAAAMNARAGWSLLQFSLPDHG
jgi:hypothetical protein